MPPANPPGRHPTAQASAALREQLRHPYAVPGPHTPAEQTEFAEYLTTRGVAITWSDRHPGAFSAQTDLCPHVWSWRQARGDLHTPPPQEHPTCPT